MDWQTYASFLGFAVLLVLMPGPDFVVVTRNALASGRRRGAWAGVGVATSNAVQGTVAALGLGALVVASQPVFEAIKWAGAAYLVLLGVQALRSAWRGDYAQAESGATEQPRGAWVGWRQGFLSNITNPKVLVFYLAVLPQFLPAGAPVWQILPLALSHALLSLTYLMLLVSGLHHVRAVLTRRRVRRALEAATGTLLLGFGASLVRETT
jgi:RhtB (resistance to homoserine/threonine) family protein